MKSGEFEICEEVGVSLLVENTARGAGILGEHGLSWCLRHGGRQLLFDLGQGLALRSNAARMGVDLERTEAVVFSHGHYDHVGGWLELADLLAEARVYMHPDALGAKYQKRPDGRMVPAGESAFAGSLQSARAKVRLSREPRQVLPAIWMTGQVPRSNTVEDTGGDFYSDAEGRTPDSLLDDQSVFFRTRRGIVVVLGCAHAGLVNTLRYIEDLTGERIHAVMGGMHLLHANEPRLRYTIEALRRIAPDWLAPNHCTGDAAVARLWQAFPDQIIEMHAGQALSFPLEGLRKGEGGNGQTV